METRCCQKKESSNFKDTRQKMSVPLAMSTNLRKNMFQTFKKTPKNIIPGQILGQDRPEKNSSQMLIRSGEIPSPRQTSIDKNNDCAMKSERGALVRGADPSSGHSVHKTTGDTCRAPARRLILTHLGAPVYGVENKRQFFRSVSDGTK